jgi:hypothetical protein
MPTPPKGWPKLTAKLSETVTIRREVPQEIADFTLREEPFLL